LTSRARAPSAPQVGTHTCAACTTAMVSHSSRPLVRGTLPARVDRLPLAGRGSFQPGVPAPRGVSSQPLWALNVTVCTTSGIRGRRALASASVSTEARRAQERRTEIGTRTGGPHCRETLTGCEGAQPIEPKSGATPIHTGCLPRDDRRPKTGVRTNGLQVAQP
jgi:hypothetical protein